MALTGLRKDTDALAVFKTAIEISPDYVPAIEAAAEIAYRQGSSEAAPLLQRLLALRPEEPTAHAMLGALAWKQSDCAGAVRHFSLAKSAIANQPDALREFGACLVKTKRSMEAAGVFRQLIVLRPEDRRARYSLAVSLIDASSFRDAITVLEPLARRHESGSDRPRTDLQRARGVGRNAAGRRPSAAGRAAGSAKREPLSRFCLALFRTPVLSSRNRCDHRGPYPVTGLRPSVSCTRCIVCPTRRLRQGRRRLRQGGAARSESGARLSRSRPVANSAEQS